MRLKHVVLLAALAPCLLALGCASDSGGRLASASDRPMKRKRGGGKPQSFESSAGAAEMGLQNEVGVYESADVEETMAEHMGEVRGCYRRAGRAQRYAGGKVTLRFAVGGDGQPTDVVVIATELGNYEVERCLVDVARAVKFPAPEGKKATTFEYPVEFRPSGGQETVQDLDDSLKLERDVATHIHHLADCGPVASGGASAVMYIESNGGVGSVGLAADSTIDHEAAACVVQKIRRHWRMSATLPGRVLRCKVAIPPAIASAAAAASPRPSTVATVRRRRR
jgi:TonB family protein